MGVIATAARDLWDAGIRGEQLFAAIAIFEDLLAEIAPREEARPTRTLTPSALRMRRHRARLKGASLPSHGVTESQRVTSHVTLCDGSDASDNRNPEVSALKEGKNSLPEREIEQSSLFEGVTEASRVTATASVRKFIGYPDDFEAFWSAYPSDEGMSKKKAFAEWSRLSKGDRDKAGAALPSFRAWAAKQFDGYRMLHAATYLSQRRFDGFAEKTARAARLAGHAATQVPVRRGTPQWEAWARYHNEVLHKGIRTSMHFDGWWFDTEWPPDHGEKKKEAVG